METQASLKKKRGLKIALIVLAVILVLVLAAVIFGASLWSNIRQNLIPTVQKPDRDSAATLATPSAELFAEALRTDIDYYETGEIKEVPIYEQTNRQIHHHHDDRHPAGSGRLRASTDGYDLPNIV